MERLPTYSEWLAETKFHPPLLSHDVIARQELVTALYAALLAHRLTLLSAPAGYGKTTLLADTPRLYPQLPLAWFTLDAEDDDPVRFWLGVLAALGHLNPASGEGVKHRNFDAFSNSDVARPSARNMQFVATLINDINRNRHDPFVLVLDDLHLVSDPTIYRGLGYLVEHMPAQMHLAVATRYDPPLPLPRWRARRQLFDLRMSELRFSPSEAALFLNQSLQLGLSPKDLALLHEQTEGWAAGLVLLTDALAHIRAGTDRAAFINAALQNRQLTFEFLADEVHGHQELAVQRFLLETSVLTELTPALCRAVTGQTNARAMLEDLSRRNLFISVIDNPQNGGDAPAYRYHALFAEFLRAQLQREFPERVAELHLRAAQAERVRGRAIGHYLAAGAWEQAAQEIEQIGDEMILQGLLGTVLGWIEGLPAPVYQNHPRLIFMRGVCALQKGNIEGVQQMFDRALTEYQSNGDRENQAAIYCALASLAFTQADFERCARFAEQASALPLHPATFVLLSMVRASLALFVESDWRQARDKLQSALQMVRSAGSTEALLYVSLYLGQEFTALPGALDLLESFCLETRVRYAQQNSPIRLGVEDVLAFILLRRGQPEQAIEMGKSALSLQGQLGGYLFLGLNSAWVVAMAYAMRRDYASAHHYLRIMQQQAGQMPLNQVIQNNGLFPLGELYWFEGRVQEARHVYRRMGELADERELRFVRALRMLLGGMLEISARQYARAEQTLLEAVQLEKREPISANFADARIFLAHLYRIWHRPASALSVLSEVLSEHQASNTPGAVLQHGPIIVPLLKMAISEGMGGDYPRHLLEILGEPLQSGQEQDRTPLTAREIEVVKLIAAGASNRSIAEKLVISVPTVKSHVAHIMNKLDASSRTQVAARARELRLI